MNGQLNLLLCSLNRPGASRSIQGEINVTDGTMWGHNPIVRPLSVSGWVYNEAGVLRVSVRAATVLSMLCDRCGVSYDLPMEILFERALSDGPCSDDDVIPLGSDAVTLDEPLTEAFLLELPAYGLCSDECRGLCHRCGRNLNESLCDCDFPDKPICIPAY
jgi:uncharacterized protein